VNGKNKIFIETDVKKINFISILKKNNFNTRNSFPFKCKIIHPEAQQKPFISIFFNNLHPLIFDVQKHQILSLQLLKNAFK
jgi:hypothetical protein